MTGPQQRAARAASGVFARAPANIAPILANIAPGRPAAMFMAVGSLLLVSPTRSTAPKEGCAATTLRASSPCFARQPGGPAAQRPPTAMVCSWRSRGDLAIGSQFCRTQRQHFGILLHISPPAGGGPRAKGLSTCSMKTKKGEPYDPPNINRMQTDDSEEWTPQGPTLFEPDFDMAQHVTDAWKHWEQMGSPRFVMAPMGKLACPSPDALLHA